MPNLKRLVQEFAAVQDAFSDEFESRGEVSVETDELYDELQEKIQALGLDLSEARKGRVVLLR